MAANALEVAVDAVLAAEDRLDAAGAALTAATAEYKAAQTHHIKMREALEQAVKTRLSERRGGQRA